MVLPVVGLTFLNTVTWESTEDNQTISPSLFAPILLNRTGKSEAFADSIVTTPLAGLHFNNAAEYTGDEQTKQIEAATPSRELTICLSLIFVFKDCEA